MSTTVYRMNIVTWDLPGQPPGEPQGQYNLPADHALEVNTGDTFSVYTDSTPLNGRPELHIRGKVTAVEREFMEVVADQHGVRAAQYTTTIRLDAQEGAGLDPGEQT